MLTDLEQQFLIERLHMLEDRCDKLSAERAALYCGLIAAMALAAYFGGKAI